MICLTSRLTTSNKVLAHLIAPDDTEGAELVEDRDPPPNAAP